MFPLRGRRSRSSRKENAMLEVPQKSEARRIGVLLGGSGRATMLARPPVIAALLSQRWVAARPST
jgi:hypothetical protein